MKILFAGTPDVACPALRLLAQEHTVIGALTRAPAPVGRQRVLTPSSVHTCAKELGLPVFTPRSLRDPEVAEHLRSLQPDLVAVVAYGLIIPPSLLTIPQHGWINLHFSLLPRWRGAAPVQYAIAAGDKETGTSVFHIDNGLDTGPVYATERYPLDARVTAEDVLNDLAHSGAQQLAAVCSAIAEGSATTAEQTGEASYAPRIRSRDVQISFEEPAHRIDAQIRGWYPAPGPWATVRGQRIKLAPVIPTDVSGIAPGKIVADHSRVLVGTHTTAVQLSDVAPAGKHWMSGVAWVRGLPDAAHFDLVGDHHDA